MNDDVKKYLKEYKELMDFMGNYIHWEDENFLYRAADDFLVKKLEPHLSSFFLLKN